MKLINQFDALLKVSNDWDDRIDLSSLDQINLYNFNTNVTYKIDHPMLTALTQDIRCETFIDDASVSHRIQCILMFTLQIN